ncbi:hypothetical protein GW17_00014432 [Ensete ventricosum]|nr:hypothetical protein GW17_00014432 [Ensete ventricosum]
MAVVCRVVAVGRRILSGELVTGLRQLGEDAGSVGQRKRGKSCDCFSPRREMVAADSLLGGRAEHREMMGSGS